MAAFLETMLIRNLPKTLLNNGLEKLIAPNFSMKYRYFPVKRDILAKEYPDANNMAPPKDKPARGRKASGAFLPASLILSLLGLLLASPATLAQWESHQNIMSTATSYVESLPPANPEQTRIEISPGKLDPRLKLTECSAPLQGNLANGTKALGRISVEVSCTGTKPWKIRLPVTVSVFVPVAISQKPIPRQKQLVNSDIFFEERDISKLFRGFYTKNDNITGMVSRMQIQAGSVLSPGLVQAPKLVKRGQTVDVFVKTSSYEIHGEGSALSDGARGDLIRVKNNSSSKIIEGIVVGPGVVRVGHQASP